MTANHNPKPLDELKLLFNKTFGNDFSVTLLQDLLAEDPVTATEGPAEWRHDRASINLSPETCNVFCRYLGLDNGGAQISVQHRKNITVHGASFCPAKHSKKNSQVIFVDPTTRAQRGGEINEIFVHRRLDKGCWVTDTFCSVHPFKELTPHESQHDPYRRYPLLDIRMYHQLKEAITIISWRDIVSHAATCTISWPQISNELIVVQSLDRVQLVLFNANNILNFFTESSCCVGKIGLGESCYRGKIELVIMTNRLFM